MKYLFIILLILSCKGREKSMPLPMTSNKCSNVKGEYHSYFDSVEKCIEKESDTKKNQGQNKNQ